jgi:FecR protein
MKRREFTVLIAGAAADWLLLRPLAASAQDQPKPDAAPAGSIGQVATLQGSATVMRANAAAATALKVNDYVFKKDTLQTGANSSLGITFDDETTFSLNANTRIVVDEFVFQDDGQSNAALFTVARGTAAFVASQVAKTGDMKIATPLATMGIRGTTGVVDVPEPGAGGGAEPRIKLYPDADGHVGRIEVFDRQGGRLGILTQGASAFALRPGAGGRLAAVPFAIPPQEAARDRGVLQRLLVSHNIGRRMTTERRRSRGLAPRPPNNPRGRGAPNQQRRGGGPQQQNRFSRTPGGGQRPRGPFGGRKRR